MKKKEENMLAKTWKELDIIYNLVAVWVVLKGSEMVGRITARYSRTGGTVFVTFHLFAGASKNENVYVNEMRRMQGWGYAKTDTGIADIMIENRDKLKEHFGIEMSDKESDVLNHWKDYIESGRFKVIRAV